MFGLGLPELLIVLVVVLILFGTAKLPQIGSGLGKAIRDFKKGIQGEELEDFTRREKTVERTRELGRKLVLEKATEALKDDHRVIEEVLAVLEKLTADPQALDAWNKAVDFIRNFADRCHHLKEEKVLFPVLEGKGIEREGGPIGTMLKEHEEGRGYVRAMADALKGKGNVPPQTVLVENAKAYLGLLREHIHKEDEILFNMADEVLSSEEQKTLLREFEEHDAKEMGAGIHEKYLRMARELATDCR